MVDYSLVYEDLKTISRLLDASGLLDYINIWIGTQPGEISIRSHVPPYYHAPGEFAERSADIKELVSLPVIGIGRINTPALAEEMLSAGKMDLVGMVRELIADPHFPNKAREGRVDDIRACIACNQSCAGPRIRAGPTHHLHLQPGNRARKGLGRSGAGAGQEESRGGRRRAGRHGSGPGGGGARAQRGAVRTLGTSGRPGETGHETAYAPGLRRDNPVWGKASCRSWAWT